MAASKASRPGTSNGHKAGNHPGNRGAEKRHSVAELMDKNPVLLSAKAILREKLLPVRNGDGWLAKPELPTGDEVAMDDLAEPLPNHPNATYASKEEYLETQYRLLRYEGVQPLRRILQGFRDNPNMMENPETCIYEKVFVKGLNVIRLGCFARVKFQVLRSERLVDWGQTERLTPGSCVALSPAEDKFRSKCWVAFVTGKDDQDLVDERSTPEIDLEFEDAGTLAALVNPGQELVMVEARSNYYEAVRNVLAGLKHGTQEESELIKYFTGNEKRVALSPEASEGPDGQIDLSAIAVAGAQAQAQAQSQQQVMMPVSGCIPDGLQAACGLDDSQLAALQRMLSRELAVVQGPPGTGKTHTSLAALKVLLSQQVSVDGCPCPIIVTAQKNDTVDDLLSRLSRSGVPCARLGGQSKHDDIIKCTVPGLRQRYIRATAEKRHEALLEFCRRQIMETSNKCFPHKNVLFVHPDDFHNSGLLSDEQRDSIMSRWEDENPSAGFKGNPKKHPFAKWIACPLFVRTQPKSIQKPCAEAADEGPSQVYLAEEDNSRSRKDGVSSQIILMSEWLKLESTPLSDEDEETAAGELEAHADLWHIPEERRCHVYQYLRRRYLELTQGAIEVLLTQIENVVMELKVERWTEDFAAITQSRARIIGCTTTGLTKYRALLSAFRPKIMIVEEAAETREANIAAALLPTIQQLMLVGDHLQLSPHADVLELIGPPYNLTVSVFERFVLRNIEYSTLSDQRRMAPQMRMVLNPWYPSLQDHTKVLELPPVPGMGPTRTLWLNHKEPECGNRYSSKFNPFEARQVTRLAQYLVLNGVSPSRITVLTFYTGQKTFIYNVMQKFPEVATEFDRERGVVEKPGVEVQTVDGYQGKENDIIILSATRSPPRSATPSVGFLSKLNRAIVALSRGKLLNVVVGNMFNLLNSTTAAHGIWKPVSEAMNVVDARTLPLVCEAHKTAFRVSTAPGIWDDPAKVGCGVRCSVHMACGHSCKGTCHPPAVAHTCFCQKGTWRPVANTNDGQAMGQTTGQTTGQASRDIWSKPSSARVFDLTRQMMQNSQKAREFQDELRREEMEERLVDQMKAPWGAPRVEASRETQITEGDLLLDWEARQG